MLPCWNGSISSRNLEPSWCSPQFSPLRLIDCLAGLIYQPPPPPDVVVAWDDQCSGTIVANRSLTILNSKKTLPSFSTLPPFLLRLPPSYRTFSLSASQSDTDCLLGASIPAHAAASRLSPGNPRLSLRFKAYRPPSSLAGALSPCQCICSD